MSPVRLDSTERDRREQANRPPLKIENKSKTAKPVILNFGIELLQYQTKIESSTPTRRAAARLDAREQSRR
jgi:hypothetical protein